LETKNPAVSQIAHGKGKSLEFAEALDTVLKGERRRLQQKPNRAQGLQLSA
jgi:hypothetical protein